MSSGRGSRNSSEKTSSLVCGPRLVLAPGGDPQQLLGVVPLVERPGLVDALVALQPDHARAGGRGDGLGQLGLADSGGALDEQRLAQPVGQVDRGRDRGRGQVPDAGQPLGHLGDRAEQRTGGRSPGHPALRACGTDRWPRADLVSARRVPTTRRLQEEALRCWTTDVRRPGPAASSCTGCSGGRPWGAVTDEPQHPTRGRRRCRGQHGSLRERARSSCARGPRRCWPARDARLRPDQWRASTRWCASARRALVVQRTGWGKSAVYFVATALLRAAGAGPTVIVSPLLALMRNQIEAAERAGICAATVNSANTAEWERTYAAVAAGEVDMLLVSPERLNNPDFRDRVLPQLTASAGMLVVDEAHCISDWGHDFRPDYRRLRDLIAELPAGHPGARHHGHGQRPGGRRRHRAAGARRGRLRRRTGRSCCAARWTGRACGCRSCSWPPPRSGWGGSPRSSTRCPGPASSTR